MQPSVKSKGPADAFGRPLLNLRISVTDRCNLRCRYCMPEEEYGWLPREELLSFEEISELAGIFTEVGIEKVRLTGGEPLLRKDLPVLVRMLAQNPRIRDLAFMDSPNFCAASIKAHVWYPVVVHNTRSLFGWEVPIMSGPIAAINLAAGPNHRQMHIAMRLSPARPRWREQPGFA